MSFISPKNSKKHVIFLTITLAFVLVLCGAVSAANTPLETIHNGTVSGDLYVNATQPVAWVDQPSSGVTSREFNQTYNLPTYTDIEWAQVYVNIYSGTGSANWPAQATIMLDGNGDGIYETTLGTELLTSALYSTDGTVYQINDHCTRVYSDYQLWYDVTGLVTCNNPSVYVKTEQVGSETYDGRLKMIALVAAYNDGDTDKVHYWVNDGQDWIDASISPSQTTFQTSTVTGTVDSATLNTVALSSKDGTYTFKGQAFSGTDPVSPVNYFEAHTWNVTSNITPGQDSTLVYGIVLGQSSFKNVLATLTIKEVAVNNGLADTPWPKFMGNNQNTGQSPYNGPKTNNIIWTYTTTGRLNYGSPAIGSDGTIYFGNSVSFKGYIFALNSDGTLKWTYNTGRGVQYSGPAIGADGTIYIGCNDNKVYALNPDGTLKWTYTTGSPIGGSPAIAMDGTIYIGSQDNKVYALNPDGTFKWTYTAGSPIRSSPAVGLDGTLYFGCNDKKLYALNPDGTLKWTYTTNREIYGAPAVGLDGTIHFGSDNLYALNPDGTLKWTYTTGSINGCPAIGSDGTIYTGTTGTTAGSIVYALNPDGTLKWTYNTSNQIFSSPAIGSDGTLYFGCNDMKLYALNPDGTLKWTYTTGNSIIGSPAIGSDGTLYIGSQDNKLYAFKDMVPVAGFSSNVTAGFEPLTVQFTDTSLYQPTSWLWDFGDGTTSTDQNPSHEYTTPGVYNVSLTVTSVVGSDTIVKNSYIKVYTQAAPVAGYTVDSTVSYLNAPVRFTDTSTGFITSWAWDFNNDGTVDSTEQNPTYVYPAVGSYTVKLTVSNPLGSDDEVKTDYISVILDTEAPVVNASPVGGTYNPPKQITLSSTDNADPNPIIYYTLDGTDPTTNSTTYTGPINITQNNVLKFIAADINGNVSPVQTETYNMVDTEAPNVTDSQNGNTVTLSATDNADPNPIIYYTFDGTDPTTNSTPYTNPITIPLGTTTVLKFIAVDVSGNVSPVNSRTYLIYGSNYYTGGRYYNGNDLETSVYAEGHINVVYSNAGVGYGGAGTVTYITADLPIPVGATIISARLYQSWTWWGYGNGDTVQFNGHESQTPVALFFDGSDGKNGQAVFDVTTYFIPGQDNTAVFTLTSSANYAPILVVIYEDPNEPYRKIWLNEGSDTIYSTYGMNADPYIAYAMFNNVTTTNASSAQMTAILPSGTPSELSFFLLNGQNIPFEGSGGTDPVFLWSNITTTLQNGTNELGVPLQISGDYFNLALALLTVTIDTTAPEVNANPIGRSFNTTKTVTLNATDDQDASPTIYYTLNGEDPTTSSTLYTGIITLDATTTLKFIAVDDVGNVSAVQTEIYTLDTVTPTVTADPVGGLSNTVKIVMLTATDNLDSNVDIYYTLNGETPTISSTLYTGPVNINSTTTLKFIAVDDADNISDVQTETYTIDTLSPGVSASIGTGVYGNSQKVTLTATDDQDINVDVYYTTDGSTPTTSSNLYAGPLTISNPTTLKFFGMDDAGNASSVQTRTYIVDTVAPTVNADLLGGTYNTPQTVHITATDAVDSSPLIFYQINDGEWIHQTAPVTINLPAGTTKLEFYARDDLRNHSSKQTRTYTVNAQPQVPQLTIVQLVEASNTIKAYYETHNQLPASVIINNTSMTMSQMLYILAMATININNSNLTPVTIKTVISPTNPSGSYKTGNLYKVSYLSTAQNIRNFINTNGRAPNYAQTNLGKIPFTKLVYMYSKIIGFYGLNTRLPNYVTI